MELDGLFDNGEPKPGTFVGGAALLERLKQIWNSLRSNAGTVVLHHDRASGADRDFDLGARRRVAYGVL